MADVLDKPRVKKSTKVITRNILLLSLVSFFTDMSSEMLYPIMPLFFTSIGLSAASIGIIEGVAEAIAGISKSFFGHLGDRLGRPEWFVRVGYGLSAISKPLLGFVSGTAAFIGIRGADRFGKGIRTAPRDAILSSESKKSVRGKVFGFHRSLDTFGAAIGPLITIALIVSLNLYNNLSKIFIYSLIPGLLAVALTFKVKSNFTKKLITRNEIKSSFTSYLRIFRPSLYTSQYKKLMVALILVGVFNSSDAFLLLRASNLLGEQTQIFGVSINKAIMLILIYILYNLVYAGLSYISGVTADKKGFRKTYLFGLVAFAVAYGILSRDLSIYGILLAFSIYAVFAAVNDAVMKAWISKQLPKNLVGTGIGVANTIISVTFLVSSILTGIIWDTYSSAVAFSILSIGMVIPIMYILFFLTETEHA